MNLVLHSAAKVINSRQAAWWPPICGPNSDSPNPVPSHISALWPCSRPVVMGDILHHIGQLHAATVGQATNFSTACEHAKSKKASRACVGEKNRTVCCWFTLIEDHKLYLRDFYCSVLAHVPEGTVDFTAHLSLPLPHRFIYRLQGDSGMVRERVYLWPRVSFLQWMD